MDIVMMDPAKLTPYENNPRDNDASVPRVAASIKEFGFRQPIVVDKDLVVIAGHTRLKAALELGLAEVPVLVADDLSPEQARAYRLADNKAGEASEWLEAMLAEELASIQGIDMEQFGFEEPSIDFSNLEAMMGERTEEYDAFLSKFKPKHTTDDCFTPPEVYDAVKTWVLQEYAIPEGTEIVRPFYPGGDYTTERYPEGCVVIDNPPFSIEAEIVRFYQEKGVQFFLFAPGLTALHSCRYGVSVVLANASITYENGAIVSTSFLTNLGRRGLKVSASLHDAVASAQPKDEGAEQTAYDWPDNIVTSAMLGRLAMYGAEIWIPDFEIVSKLDDGTQIYGKGALISDSMAEKLKAEKLKAEKPRKTVRLSEREREVVRMLNEREQTVSEAVGLIEDRRWD